MRYVEARLTEKAHALAYRIYVTDALYYSSRGNSLNMRYQDLYESINDPKPQETRTKEEVVEHIRNKMAGLKE